MRAKEFLSEAGQGKAVIYKPKKFKHGKLGVPVDTLDPLDVHSRTQSNTEYGTYRDKLNPEQELVMRGAIGVPNENPYDLYRLGVAIAGGERNIPEVDSLGQTGMIIPFSEAEHENIHSHMRRQGLKPEKLSTHGSEEPLQNNKVSPIAKIKRNRYGI
jgi:hypothetical protein